MEKSEKSDNESDQSVNGCSDLSRGGEGDKVTGSGNIDQSCDEENVKPSVSVPTDHLQHLCSDMFTKFSQYMNGEIECTLEDYKLLERMNLATIEKYDGVLEMAKNTGNNLHLLNQKLCDLQPYLDEIETIESKVLALEQAAYKLDAYSKRLEERFRRLEG